MRITRIYNNLRYEVVILAFGEGLLAAHHLTFFFLYTKHFKLDLLTYTIFETILSILFCLNPALGYFSDSFSLCGTKKKGYLILIGLFGSMAYAFCALNDFMSISVWVVFAMHFFIDLLNAFRTVLLDSLCVILHNIHKYGIKNTTHKSSTSSVGMLFACRLAGRVVSMIIFGVAYGYLDAKCILNSLFHSFSDHNGPDIDGVFPERAEALAFPNKPRP